MFAVEDAVLALEDMLAEPETARLLPRPIFDTLHAHAEGLRSIQDMLAYDADDITRDRNDEDVLDTMDEIADDAS
jgi:hypothetical protein